jgi:hypothetical protein
LTSRAGWKSYFLFNDPKHGERIVGKGDVLMMTQAGKRWLLPLHGIRTARQIMEDAIAAGRPPAEYLGELHINEGTGERIRGPLPWFALPEPEPMGIPVPTNGRPEYPERTASIEAVSEPDTPGDDDVPPEVAAWRTGSPETAAVALPHGMLHAGRRVNVSAIARITGVSRDKLRRDPAMRKPAEASRKFLAGRTNAQRGFRDERNGHHDRVDRYGPAGDDDD